MPTRIIHNSKFIFQNFKHFSTIPWKRLIGKRGYTLIELLIVLAIIGILSSIILANYRNFGQRQEVRNASAEIKTELRKYQNFAISGQKNPDPSLAGSNNCQATGTLGQYQLIFVSWIGWNIYIADLYCPDWTNWTRLKNIRPAWTEEVEIERVGYVDGATDTDCRIIFINFRPLNEDPELRCWGVDVTGVADRMYIQVVGTDPNVRYRINVTPAGEIYDERI